MAGKAQNPGHFLVGIAGLIRNSEGDYLLMKRGAARDFGAESWECVTGRVNQGESIEQALHRWLSAAAAARFLSNGLSGSTNLVEQTDCLQFAGAVPPRALGPDLPRPARRCRGGPAKTC